MTRILVSIGCNDYQFQDLDNLNAAVGDATSFFDLLVRTNLGDYDPAISQLLSSPTLDDIRRALEIALFQDEPIDTFTFFFAGHGCVKDGTYYLCTHDSRLDRLSATALPISSLFTLLNEAQPRQSNIVIDACHAGGVVSDLSALLKPEVIGGANTPGITIFASSASGQAAREALDGGIGTVALLRCLSGEVVVQTNRSTLDLIEVGRMVSEEISQHHQQTPVLWGLNLFGQARFSKNPHYGEGMPPTIPTLTSFVHGSTQNNMIRAHASAIWREYLSADADFQPRRLIEVLSPIIDGLSDDPNAVGAFIEGISNTFAPRLRLASDPFSESVFIATCMVALLPLSGRGNTVDGMVDGLARRLCDAVSEALEITDRELEKSKYALLSSQSGLADLFYLPLRITQLFGWIGLLHVTSHEIGQRDLFDKAGVRKFVQSVIKHYIESISAMSDTQAPYLVAFVRCCLDHGWSDEIENVLGCLFSTFIGVHGKVARSDIGNDHILQYLLNRNEGQFDDGELLVAQPSELFPALLQSYVELGNSDLIDDTLIDVDHLHYNLFFAQDHRDFGCRNIEDGINLTYQIGHGIWNMSDFENAWGNTCIESIRADQSLGHRTVRLGAMCASMLFPDRVPWYLFTMPQDVT